jgi:hypothetical protein
MGAVKSTSMDEVRDYFRTELEAVLKRRKLDTEREAVPYLADVLVSYQRAEDFFAQSRDGRPENNVLAFLYCQAQTADPFVRERALKRLGDICLLVTGVFPDSLRRKVVDVDYYFGMGGSAYHALAGMQFTELARTLYEELATKFVVFSDVLGEFAEKSGLTNDGDLLRLYERWLSTGSDRLRDKLLSMGVVPMRESPLKTKQ